MPAQVAESALEPVGTEGTTHEALTPVNCALGPESTKPLQLGEVMADPARPGRCASSVRKGEPGMAQVDEMRWPALRGRALVEAVAGLGAPAAMFPRATVAARIPA